MIYCCTTTSDSLLKYCLDDTAFHSVVCIQNLSFFLYSVVYLRYSLHSAIDLLTF